MSVSWSVEGVNGSGAALRTGTPSVAEFRLIDWPVNVPINSGTIQEALLLEISTSGNVTGTLTDFQLSDDIGIDQWQGQMYSDGSLTATTPTFDGLYSEKFVGTFDATNGTLTGTLYNWDGSVIKTYTQSSSLTACRP
jgi:hypothetical protein